MYNDSVAKMSNKIMNLQTPERLFNTFAKNRTVRIKYENKIAQHEPSFGLTNVQQKTFKYQALKIYNSLPANLTLMEKTSIFKKWYKKWEKNKSFQPNLLKP